jgi:hypothetical protein
MLCQNLISKQGKTCNKVNEKKYIDYRHQARSQNRRRILMFSNAFADLTYSLAILLIVDPVEVYSGNVVVCFEA